MYLVVIEWVEDEGKEWEVLAHGPNGLKTFFPTIEAADKFARDYAEEGVGNNRIAVVEIKSWLQREVTRKIVETRIG